MLIDRILSEDAEAFRQLTRRYANFVFQIAYGVLQHAGDAEDAAQETFVKMYLSLSRYERKGFRSWLARIAVNKAIDMKRKAAVRRESVLPDTDKFAEGFDRGGADDTVQVVLDRERRRLIAKNIKRLPENYRKVMVPYYFEQKSYAQIAREQGVAVKTVASKLYRAKRWMRKHWKEDD